MKNLQKELSLIKDSVRKLYDAQKQKKSFDAYYEEVRKKEQVAISNFMFSHLPESENTFTITLDEGQDYYANHVMLSVTKVRRKKVIWFVDKLKEKLSKNVYKQVVEKTYTVNDMDGLIKYLKTCGVDPKKFKKFIDVEETVDETKINNMYEKGEIKKQDVSGCYKVEHGEPYIRLTETR